jgi:hypothetical protein
MHQALSSEYTGVYNDILYKKSTLPDSLVPCVTYDRYSNETKKSNNYFEVLKKTVDIFQNSVYNDTCVHGTMIYRDTF